MIEYFSVDSSTYASVAQWIEHLTTDQKVGGSSPFGRTFVLRSFFYFKIYFKSVIFFCTHVYNRLIIPS